jgi:hypothetical protein
MSVRLDPPLQARDGRTLQVLAICRISTLNQDERSLADQEALYRHWLTQHSDLPVKVEVIAGRGSGEDLRRPELLKAVSAVETDLFDLVLTEDLGRICRRSFAREFCGICLDHGTSQIALNDCVDTGRDDWSLTAFFASFRHELYNADTGKRIRRSHRNRFQQGGVVQTVVYGYLKPRGATSDAEVQKDPQAIPIFEEIVQKLENGASYSEVADWLNAEGIKPGPYVRSRRWTCAIVTRLIHNPILKGVRVRNKKMSKRINETGRRKSVPAPPTERLERNCPHLAFIEAARYDRLIKQLDERNAWCRRKGVNGVDTRKNVPKKRTIWPGQHMHCGICGRLFVYGGHGQKNHLACGGIHDYACWNAISIDGPLAARNMIKAIRKEIESLPEFDAVLLQQVHERLQQRQGAKGQQQKELDRRRANIVRELQHLVDAIKQAGHSSSLVDELHRLEQEKTQIDWEQQQLARASDEPLELPSIAEIRTLAAREFESLSMTSPEFGRLLRRFIPRIEVRPYRLCDGGYAVLRAHFTFNLVPLLPQIPVPDSLAMALERSLVVDLFEKPQREAYRVPIMELTQNRLKQRDIAWELEITQPAVQRAVALSNKMAALGISDPYVPLTEPPADYKLRRHRHPRYHFDPQNSQSGAEPPPSA